MNPATENRADKLGRGATAGPVPGSSLEVWTPSREDLTCIRWPATLGRGQSWLPRQAFFQSPGKSRHPLGQGSQFFYGPTGYAGIMRWLLLAPATRHQMLRRTREEQPLRVAQQCRPPRSRAAWWLYLMASDLCSRVPACRVEQTSEGSLRTEGRCPASFLHLCR